MSLHMADCEFGAFEWLLRTHGDPERPTPTKLEGTL